MLGSIFNQRQNNAQLPEKPRAVHQATVKRQEMLKFASKDQAETLSTLIAKFIIENADLSELDVREKFNTQSCESVT